MKMSTILVGYFACIVGVVTDSWTDWSPWSSCSRTCDGGIATQTRTCYHNPSDNIWYPCGGQGIRYRICEIQSCNREDTDDVIDVCSALDDVEFNGNTFKWSSSVSEIRNDCHRSCSPTDDDGLSVEPAYVNLPDGTRCNLLSSPGSENSSFPHSPSIQGVCLTGVCQTVGCDGVVGSKTALDSCGICGGNDAECLSRAEEKQSSVVYQWRESGYSTCSTTCGIGEESVVTTCREITSDVIVSDDFCLSSSTAGDKPHRTRVCFRSDCHENRAVWITDEWQSCSESCDGGLSVRSVFCVLNNKDDETYERTTEDQCDYEQRPDTERKCNDFECPKWIAGQWSHCSVSCGVGVQQRAIVCKRTDVLDCDPAEKPPPRRPCRQPVPCPFHHTVSEMWNLESNSDSLHGAQGFEGSFDINGRLIGDSERGNEVAEHAAPEQHHTKTTTTATTTPKQPEEKDATERTEPRTHTTTSEQLSQTLGTSEERQRQHQATSSGSDGGQLEFDLHEPDSRVSDSVQNNSSSDEDTIFEQQFENWNSSLRFVEVDYGNETDEDNSEIDDEFDLRGGDIDGRTGEDLDRKWWTDGAYRGGPPVENKKATTVPSFVVSHWSRCSATCGTAIKRRKVVCKVLLEPSMIEQELPDFRCTGPKPYNQDYCSLQECPSKPEPHTDSWMLTGYGPCSKTCGGGIQEGEYNCVRTPKYYKVDPIRCLRQPRPPRHRRPCNLEACPPRWNPLPYGPCSVSCGGGQHTRQLQCVQDTHDQKTRIVPDGQCRDIVSPPTSAPCNLVPCPAKWSIGNWTKCSVTCGQGIQTRLVECEQKLSSHQLVVVDAVSCWQQTDKPDTERTCEAGKCHKIKNLSSKSTVIRSENSNFVQLKPLSTVSLTVGTNASLIVGSTITIQCPLAKKFSRLKVVWSEGDKAIDFKKRRRLSVDRHGSLRVRNSRSSDRGVYTCVAGDDSANTTVRFLTVDESLRELRTRLNFLKEERKKTSYSEDFAKNFQSELKKLFAKMRRATYSGHLLISKMPPNAVPLQYVPFGWSPCSVECGGGGIQSRDVVCTIIADDFILEVDEGFCADRRLQKPIADRDCGFGKCPHWEPGSWGQCADDNCVAVGVGERRREPRCISPHGERLDADRCRGQQRPTDREGCQNSNCTAVWKPSNWTKCSITCGGKGIKTRNLKCVWRQSKKSAVGSLCSLQPKPASSKACYATTPCPSTGCRDESKYCHMIPGLQMCRFPQYRQECCLSCSLVRASSTAQQITSPNYFVLK